MRNARPPQSLADEIGKRGAFDTPEQEAYLNLVRTHAHLSNEFATLFKAHGLTESQYNVLRIVAGAGQAGKTMEGIASEMIARDPDVTRLVDRLEDGGLVERRRSEEDRRVVIVRGTTKGQSLLRQLAGPVVELHRSQLGHLGARRLRSLNEILFQSRRPA